VDLGLTNRAYLVTGGTSGMGFAVAQCLVEEGASVVVASRSRDRVDAAVARLGDRARGIPADISDPGAPDVLIDEVLHAFGRIDGAFISHGGPPGGDALDLDDDKLEAALELAAAGPIRLLRQLGRRLDAGSAVVVLTSTSSVEPIAGLASSNATRPAVLGYAKTLADEVGPRGIRVNVLLPGRFVTERLSELHERVAQEQGKTFDEVRADASAWIPLRRIGDPVELGRVGAFLLSPAASYVTGSAWRVDGGAVRGL